VPALLALAKAVVDREQLLLAVRISADQNQDALLVVLEAWREVNPIRPDVDVPVVACTYRRSGLYSSADLGSGLVRRSGPFGSRSVIPGARFVRQV
jgi:hypothetical protein